MSKIEDRIFVVALLYSRCRSITSCEKEYLREVLKVIRDDEILSQIVHIISIDNGYCRNLLKFNKNATIHHWPVFAVKYPGEKHPKIYPISYSEVVFREVYDAYIDRELARPKNKGKRSH